MVEMPLNLAVLDMNAADGIAQQYSQAKSWYIDDHLLGGSMAESYAAKHADGYEGLVLPGAHSTEAVSQSGMAVISVFGFGRSRAERRRICAEHPEASR